MMIPPFLSPQAQRVRNLVLILGALLVHIGSPSSLLGDTPIPLCGPVVPAGQPFPDDPVEQFRDALRIEENKTGRAQLPGRFLRDLYKDILSRDKEALKKALDFRRKNLEGAAARLKTLSDLARTLLLTEWPRPPQNLAAETEFDREARKIEQRIRQEIADRLVEGAKRNARQGRVAQKIATAQLIAETVSIAGEQVDEWRLLGPNLLRLAPVLEDLTTQTNDEVRQAAARAMGHFPSSPEIATRALKRLLSSSNPEATRKAAADGLVTMAEGISPSLPARGSEPGVSVRESRRAKQLQPIPTLFPVVEKLVPAAAVGLQDTSTSVRRQCIRALRITSEAVAYEVRHLPSPPVYYSERESPYPPSERKEWSKDERARVQLGRVEVAQELTTVMPALRVIRDNAEPLAGATVDRDATVRLEARRMIEALARTRETIRNIWKVIPTDPEKGKKGAGESRRRPSGIRRVSFGGMQGGGGGGQFPPQHPRLVSTQLVLSTLPPILPPPVGTRAEDEKQEDEKNDKDDKKIKGVDEKEDPLASLLERVVPDLAASGICDPDVRARRAAVEAIEAMGEKGAAYIPALVRALKDPDLFVRWIAARTLGSLAPQGADLAVPGLACQLEDPDIDARIAAARALGYYGPHAASAVPALARSVLKGDAEFRVEAMKAIEGIGTAGTSALPQLAESLRETNPRIRAEAARTIGRFGTLAREYVPALKRLADDPDVDVRRTANAAILNILAED